MSIALIARCNSAGGCRDNAVHGSLPFATAFDFGFSVALIPLIPSQLRGGSLTSRDDPPRRPGDEDPGIAVATHLRRVGPAASGGVQLPVVGVRADPPQPLMGRSASAGRWRCPTDASAQTPSPSL